MSGCSLQEAFPDTAKRSGEVARREERTKAKRCGGPALAFLKSLDPDRQAHTPLPPAERVDGRQAYEEKKRMEGYATADRQGRGTNFSEGYENQNREWAPEVVTPEAEAERELVKNLVGQRVDDVIGSKSRKTLPRAADAALSGATSVAPAQLPDFSRTEYGDPVPSYFGKSLEGMADFSSSLADNTGYTVQGADFQGSFSSGALEKATGAQSGSAGADPLLSVGELARLPQTLPIPSLNNVWKPITPTGANTSFFEVPQQTGRTESAGAFSQEEKQSLLHKLDTLFARLEDLESKRNEYAHAEVTLFIISGLVLMFGLESVRKLR